MLNDDGCRTLEFSAMFADALVSSERSAEISAEDDLYGGLIGEWDVRVRDIEAGSAFDSNGTWHFARILDGRGIQDVFICPPRPKHGIQSGSRGRYGTSVRTFDPAMNRWRVVWFNPLAGAFDVLYARKYGGAIIQEGMSRTGKQIRWVFQEIAPTKFHWTGETQQPDGAWLLEAEFFGKRKK
jgi:hypothetical protein